MKTQIVSPVIFKSFLLFVCFFVFKISKLEAQYRGFEGSIVLSYSYVELVGDGVYTYWGTLGEPNGTQYSLTHSTSGTDWHEIETLPAIGSSGGQLCEYAVFHKTPPAGINYYRLIARDIDGVEEVLKILPIEVEDPISRVQSYPNPAQEHLNLVVNMPERCQIEISLFSIDGRLLEQKKLSVEKGLNTTSIESGKCHKGINLLVVKCRFFEETSFIIKG